MLRRAWVLGCLTVLLTGGMLSAGEAEDVLVGLKGYWPLDQSSGTNVPDFTINRNDGWFDVGAPAWIPGKFSNALEVSAATFDRVVIPHHASYNENNAYSISFWFIPISVYRKYNLFNKGAGKLGMGHSAGGGDVLWQYFGSPWNTQASTLVALSATNWHHFVAIYDASVSTNDAKKVYVDGFLTLSTNTVGIATDPALNTDPLAFNSTDTNRVGSGRFDDLAIWNRSLTTNEIAYLYNGGVGNIVQDYPPRGTVVSLY